MQLKYGAKWLLRGVAASVAMRTGRRVGDAELREWCDVETEGDLDDVELDRLVRLVKEHPAYQAIPGEDPPPPTGDREEY